MSIQGQSPRQAKVHGDRARKNPAARASAPQATRWTNITLIKALTYTMLASAHATRAWGTSRGRQVFSAGAQALSPPQQRAGPHLNTVGAHLMAAGSASGDNGPNDPLALSWHPAFTDYVPDDPLPGAVFTQAYHSADTLEPTHPAPSENLATAVPTAHFPTAKAAYQARIIADTAVFRGHEYYISNNHTFLGPWTEERFFNFWQSTEPQVERFYLPIGWTGSELVNRAEWRRVNNWAMSFYLNSLDKTATYFTLIQIARGFENGLKLKVEIPQDLNLTVFATGPTTATHLVALPLLKEVMVPQGLAKDITVSFTGTFGAHPARGTLREMYGEQEGWVFEEPHGQWAQVIERSRYVLCPRGWGLTSFRMYETLQLGSIPIYVVDHAGPWLPYQDLISWEDICIVMHQDDLALLGPMIAENEASGKTGKMLQRVQALRSVWTYEFMNNYILRHLHTPHTDSP